jgi:hypothetical protein
MTAYGRALDHPYAAVTKADGNYEIKNVPAGAKLKILVWHPKAPNGGWVTDQKGEEITIKEGGDTKDFKLTAK